MVGFSTVYFGNTILSYLIALGVVAGSIVAGKILYWLISNVVKVFTQKTETKLDDILIEALQGPAIFFLFYVGFNYAYRLLSFPEHVMTIFGNIAYILLAINVAWLLINIVDAIIQEYFAKIAAKTKSDIDDQLMPIVRTLVKVIIVIIAIISILDNMGFDIASLLAGLGIGGLAFALAAQDTLKNLFGGITIFADKPFKVGDRIKLDDSRDGFVRTIGVRSTILETFDGTQIIVPNAKITDSILENISRESARRVKASVGVEYGTSMKKMEEAIKIIKEIIVKNKDTEDRSFVTFDGFGDFSLNIQIIYWIKNKDNILIAKHNINMEIKKQFEKAKINMAFPTSTVYLKKGK
ncbi:mechanosensitive ion channel protein MscL [Candidatus Woesearchaeota archaeon CG10_big_fil_rev_8_21_14_0_10_32_9]|nr:MAG: mechanosensitive ion channel protein MscL [Candidatus Woesearchaeota archaeon CG10_big_fil_rev_8_21_14_0_10_32_9]